MGFYARIAEYYDRIFPFSEKQADFVTKTMKDVPGKMTEQRILDIGCGTGALTAELGRRGFHITGIDFDREMIARAEERKSAEFMELDMRKIDSVFDPGSSHGIFCFGNTLVHLTGPGDIAGFIRKVYALLASAGTAGIQIVNYDRILDRDIRGLPTIENDTVRFQRNYRLDSESGLLDFHTVLTVKSTGAEIENTVPLYPLRRKELLGFLDDAGFSELKLYGGFDGSPFTADSLPLIVTGKKQ